MAADRAVVPPSAAVLAIADSLEKGDRDGAAARAHNSSFVLSIESGLEALVTAASLLSGAMLNNA